MGLLLLIMYLPAYGVVTALSLLLSKVIVRRLTDLEVEIAVNVRQRMKYLGLITATVLTWVAMFQVPVHGNMDWNSFLLKGVTSLLGPFVFALVVMIVLRGPRRAFFAIGALFAGVFMPVSLAVGAAILVAVQKYLY